MDIRFKNKRVLLLEGYGRQILPYLKEYKKLGCKTTVICGSKLDLAYVSRYVDKRIIGICDMDRPDETEKFVVETIKSGQFDVVVPMGDFAAKILSKNKEELKEFASIAVNDYDVFERALDKLSVMKVCQDNGIPCPKTLFGVSLPQHVAESKLTYPLVVKPRSDCGARGFFVFHGEMDFFKYAENIDLTKCVIQEYIPQTNKNMSVGLFIDSDGNLKSSYMYASRRWYPLKGGTGTLNELIDRPDVVEMCYQLARIMKLSGTIGFDLIDDPRDGVPKIIEINPRVLACAKIGFEAGVNQAQQLLEKELSFPVTEYKTKKIELFVRMSQIDMLWFIKSPGRFRGNPSWFRVRNVRDQTFSFSDPLPWFAFLLRGLTHFGKEMEKRTP